MKIPRSSRLNGEYQKEISEIIRTSLKDREPRLSGLISVTGADVAPDLKTAKIYVSVYAESEEKKLRSFELLRENAGFIRHELAQVMRMRTVPVLTFLWDGSMTYGAKMDELFRKIHAAGNDGADGADENAELSGKTDGSEGNGEED